MCPRLCLCGRPLLFDRVWWVTPCACTLDAGVGLQDLVMELQWATHLGVAAIVIPLRGPDCCNLASITNPFVHSADNIAVRLALASLPLFFPFSATTANTSLHMHIALVLPPVLVLVSACVHVCVCMCVHVRACVCFSLLSSLTPTHLYTHTCSVLGACQSVACRHTRRHLHG